VQPQPSVSPSFEHLNPSFSRFESLETFSRWCSDLALCLKDAEKKGCKSCLETHALKARLDKRILTVVDDKFRQMLIQDRSFCCAVIDLEQKIANELNTIFTVICQKFLDLGYVFPDEIQTIVDWHDTMVQTENRDESLAAQLHEMEMIFRAMRDLKIRIDSASRCVGNVDSYLSADFNKWLTRDGDF